MKKAVIVSSGVVSAAVLLKLSLPLILDFLLWELPTLWSMALTWLQPPYLYLLINCIILSIVASSKLHNNHPPPQPQPYLDFPAHSPQDSLLFPSHADSSENAASVTAEEEGEKEIDGHGDGDEEDEEEEYVVARSAWIPPKRGNQPQQSVLESSTIGSVEKPPVSARFARRKAHKPSPEGKTLRVSRPKKQETLESTWRTITEGRPMPLKRHLKKSDTFSAVSGDGSPASLKKSQTLGGGGSPSPGSSSGGRLRREPSLSQDELNRRVEAFIHKFNQEMRMQRQESLSHFRNMVGPGAH